MPTSVDPELGLPMLLDDNFYGIRSKCGPIEDDRLDRTCPWYCKLDLEGGMPERSTFVEILLS